MREERKIVRQILRFGCIGGICFCIDATILYILTIFAKIDYLWSAAIAFTISLIFNYIFSMKYVFTNTNQMRSIYKAIIFLGTALVGLGINQISMKILTESIELYFMISKVIATGIVMIFNFISRKILLEINNR